MRIVADLHIHSKFSRSVSERMLLENLDAWADDKGIIVMGTGDFTHPLWFKEIESKLEPAERGLFKLSGKFKKDTLKGTKADTRFMLTAEISCIYKRGGRARRVHHILLAPDIETVRKINKELSLVGNLRSDGRPILGLDSENLLKIILEASPRAALIPAHIWTPWFAVFGSMSGFDSLEECFGNLTKHIFAVETGLSSDPSMNWRVSSLDNVALVSNSDSHSLERIGREANVFDCELSYDGIIEAIKQGRPAKRKKGSPSTSSGQSSRFIETIEFFPEEGRYHFDGHRLCGISWSPAETEKHNGICSVCGQAVTVGVENRVSKLADRREGYIDEYRVPYRRLITLDKVIGEALDVGAASKAVKREYEKIVRAFKSELFVLIDARPADIALASKPEIAEAVERMRAGKLKIKPGFDGEYGEIKIFSGKDRKRHEKQASLFNPQ